jgi:chloramphenicol-sensitive protein RarD
MGPDAAVLAPAEGGAVDADHGPPRGVERAGRRGWLGWKYGRGWLRETLSRPHAATMLALSGVLIAFNWGLYIWAVNAGHVVESSLGYFINPLLNVVLGVLVLRERLNRVQWVSVGIAAAGVLWLTFSYGSFPWIALSLAASFGAYGLVRKLLGVAGARAGRGEPVPAAAGAGVLLWSEKAGQGHLLPHGDASVVGLGRGSACWCSAACSPRCR